MPAWIATLLINLGVFIVKTYGIPYLESKFPALVPLLAEILAILNGQQPSTHLQAAGDHYNSLKSA